MKKINAAPRKNDESKILVRPGCDQEFTKSKQRNYPSYEKLNRENDVHPHS
ncbi:hypothetical protein [Aporhodopirellula aestuarii]|uniref:Uncharacterized protein n=1 Tax=Aporhodopirellula aestuarii TaxID=2950107 RepID=A0ABT0U204_9BACT|nr:hypothetical protein [Aporhodopirellula aestuarii]MCM2370918.1 hypothetical protein [Aporhodopirellula aestuarii]